MTQKNSKLSRRNFLLQAGVGGVAAAAAVVAGKQAAQSPSGNPGKRQSQGYHATEHINNYYRTAKV